MDIRGPCGVWRGRACEVNRPARIKQSHTYVCRQPRATPQVFGGYLSACPRKFVSTDTVTGYGRHASPSQQNALRFQILYVSTCVYLASLSQPELAGICISPPTCSPSHIRLMATFSGNGYCIVLRPQSLTTCQVTQR